MFSRPKKFLSHFLIVIIFIFVCLFFVWQRVMHKPLLTRGAETSIKVYPGSTIHDIARHLNQRGLMTHPDVFILVALLRGDAKQLRFGEYRITPGMNASQLLSNIVAGKGVVKYRITFVEGWTFQDIKKILEQNNNLRHLLKDKTNKEIMGLFGHPKQHPEGRFFPDTYVFIWGNTDLEILQHAYQRMQKFLSEQWEDRAVGLPYKTAYQALIVASLIEKETSLENERPIIAGIILRRLEKRMRLQVDPTVLYGLEKSFGSVISKRDLRSNTAYNTYRIYGLPPTPIDMPSAASIIAALHPAQTNYLYYVARGGRGSCVFCHLSATFKRCETDQKAERG